MCFDAHGLHLRCHSRGCHGIHPGHLAGGATHDEGGGGEDGPVRGEQRGSHRRGRLLVPREPLHRLLWRPHPAPEADARRGHQGYRVGRYREEGTDGRPLTKVLFSI